VIIGIAYFIAGWSFRISCFGWVFVWDYVTLRHRRFVPDRAANRVFLASEISQVPVRTYGTLRRDEGGGLMLSYRSWLVLPRRSLALPKGQYMIGRGIFYSQIMRLEGQGLAPAVLLPPRYRGHEEALVSGYGLEGVQDAGLRAIWRWLKEALGFRGRPAGAPA